MFRIKAIIGFYNTKPARNKNYIKKTISIAKSRYLTVQQIKKIINNFSYR